MLRKSRELQRKLDHEIAVREEIAASQQEALREVAEGRSLLGALLTVVVAEHGEDGGEVVGLWPVIHVAKGFLKRGGGHPQSGPKKTAGVFGAEDQD